MDTVNESIARIEAIIGRKVKRDIGQMTEWAKGNLARAAEAIMNTPNAHVGIVTGFYIQHAEPPSPETDGLGGMAHLAAGLANAGIPVTIITDTPCAKAVWAVVDALPMPVNLEVVSTTESSVLRLRQYQETGDRPITHLIAIERVSPASDGKPHREHGWDMTRETAPLHLLFDDPAAKRRWGYFALPVLHHDRLVGKVDATADRKAGVLRVNAIHEDVKFTRAIAKGVQAELDDLATWLGLERG